MAHKGSWPSIMKHGLLSTTALLDLFQISGADRRSLEEQLRLRSEPIRHPEYGKAVVRDQKPMTEPGLRNALQDGLSQREWLLILNSKAFFWLTRARLDGLLSARPYRALRRDVLTVDTKLLLERHSSRVRLCHMNSGCTQRSHPRGRRTFLPMEEYPFGSPGFDVGRRVEVGRGVQAPGGSSVR